MAAALDFTKLETWQTVDIQTACMRIGSEPGNEKNGCNIGALSTAVDAYKIINDSNTCAQFFLNCETLGLRGSKLFRVYKYSCGEDYSALISAVLNKDQKILNLPHCI